MAEFDTSNPIKGRDEELEKKIFDDLHGRFVNSYVQTLEPLDKDKRFIKDNRYHDVHSSHHIVYKLRVVPDTDETILVNKDGSRGYEFLIEFDLEKPSYGIYYGCRALIFGKNQTQEIINLQTEWDKKIKAKVCEVLNNTFQKNNFYKRCLLTDNANNKTYWPFWIRLSEDEDIIEYAGLAIQLIYNVYKVYLEDENSEKLIPAKDQAKEPKQSSVTNYTKKSFDLLFKDKPKTKKIVNKLIRKAVSMNLLINTGLYEKAWNYNKHKFGSDTEFAYFLERIYSEIIRPNNNNETKTYDSAETLDREKKKRYINSTIWALFIPYLLSDDGRPLTNLRKAYDKDYFTDFNPNKPNEKEIKHKKQKRIDGYIEDLKYLFS